MGAGASTAKHPFPDEAAASLRARRRRRSIVQGLDQALIYLPVVTLQQIHLLVAGTASVRNRAAQGIRRRVRVVRVGAPRHCRCGDDEPTGSH